MRETTIRDFLNGEISASRLQKEADSALIRVNEIESNIAITPMTSDFDLTRNHIQKLCNTFLDGELTAEAITTIAFSLIATDHFCWEDDVMSEVIFDWSCPEVNYPINAENIRMNLRWLAGIEPLPIRPPIDRNAKKGKVVSIRRSV
ncbi:MAG: hypothetical protein KGN79_16440 [Acidobacteriota bacterium]|nr:hypothetical protein [Acidobacteriota bacterium]